MAQAFSISTVPSPLPAFSLGNLEAWLLRYPYHFRATSYGIYPLTATIYGSTLSIPEHF